MTIALLDGDIIAYRCAASCEPTKSKPDREPLISAISRADELVYRCLNRLAPERYQVFLGGTENFRKQVDPNYKANRTQPKPEYLDAVRDLLVREWEAEVCAGYEADDGLGISASAETIIASIDKDLLQIPGRHYNFVKDEIIDVSPRDAARSFYGQMLTGDSSDNVHGIDGIGPVRSGRLLSGVDPQDMEALVKLCYEDAGKSGGDYVRNFLLLRIIRSKQEWESIEAILSQGQGESATEASMQEHIRNFSRFD